MESLLYIKKYRDLPFVKIGMKIEICYRGKKKRGVITGENSSGCLEVQMEGANYSTSHHPRWAIKYFDEENNIIVEFPE